MSSSRRSLSVCSSRAANAAELSAIATVIPHRVELPVPRSVRALLGIALCGWRLDPARVVVGSKGQIIQTVFGVRDLLECVVDKLEVLFDERPLFVRRSDPQGKESFRLDKPSRQLSYDVRGIRYRSHVALANPRINPAASRGTQVL